MLRRMLILVSAMFLGGIAVLLLSVLLTRGEREGWTPPPPELSRGAEVASEDEATSASSPEVAERTSSTSTPAPTRKTVNVTGLVTDLATGTPVSNATISLFDKGHDASATTEEDGRYTLEVPEQDAIALVCEAKGYARLRKELQSVAGRDALTLDFALNPGASVAGKVVVAPGGKAIADLSVRVWERTEGAAFAFPTQTSYDATTDQNGTYVVEGIPSGTYIVGVHVGDSGYLAPEGPPRVISLEAGKTYDGVDFALEMGAEVVGTVFDPRGKPAAGVRLRVMPTRILEAGMSTLQSGDVEAIMRGARADEQGQYSIKGLRFEREYLVRASAENAASTSSEPFAIAKGRSPVRMDVRLTSGSTVSGRAQFPNGTAAPDVRISLFPAFDRIMSGDFSEPMQETTDAQGRFTFSHVSAGEYHVFAGGVNPMAMMAHGTESPDATRPRVTLDGKNRVEGVVVTVPDVEDRGIIVSVLTQEGQPASGVRVEARPIGMPFQEQTLTTDDTGIATFKDLNGARYDLYATRDSECADAAGVALGESVTLRLVTAASVSGFVVNAEGRSVEGASVHVRSVEEENPYVALMSGMVGSVQPQSKTDAEGAFTLTGLRPGKYALDASAPDQGKGATEPFDVAAGDHFEDVVVALEKGVRVSGYVRDRGGRALAGATVRLSPQVEGPAGMLSAMMPMPNGKSAITNEAGAFELTDVAAGAYHLSASMPGYANAAPSPLDVAGRDVTGCQLVLYRGAKAKARLVQEGVPRPGVMFQLMGPTGFYTATTDSNGESTIEGITPGRYMLQTLDMQALVSGGMRQAMGQIPRIVDVVDGQDIDLTAEPDRGAGAVGGSVSGLSPESLTVLSVRRPGGPAPEEWSLTDLNAMMDAYSYYEGQTVVNPDGSFQLEGLRPGNYILEVLSVNIDLTNPDPAAYMSMDRTPQIRQELTISNDKPVNLNLAFKPAAPK